jgi:dTDP-4-amino-4,6-dideoxygalactose transaminase
MPVHFQQAYQHLGYGPGSFPEAERACREILSLPLYPELPEEAIRYTCSAITSFRAEG